MFAVENVLASLEIMMVPATAVSADTIVFPSVAHGVPVLCKELVYVDQSMNGAFLMIFVKLLAEEMLTKPFPNTPDVTEDTTISIGPDRRFLNIYCPVNDEIDDVDTVVIPDTSFASRAEID